MDLANSGKEIGDGKFEVHRVGEIEVGRGRPWNFDKIVKPKIS